MPLERERVDIAGRRDAVERHVDDRRHPARGGGGRRAGKPLPLGASGVVDVDVRIDQPGQQHLVRPDLDHPIGADRIVRSPQVADVTDPAVIDGDTHARAPSGVTACGARISSWVIADRTPAGRGAQVSADQFTNPASNTPAAAMERAASGSRSLSAYTRSMPAAPSCCGVNSLRPATAITGMPRLRAAAATPAAPCRPVSARRATLRR